MLVKVWTRVVSVYTLLHLFAMKDLSYRCAVAQSFYLEKNEIETTVIDMRAATSPVGDTGNASSDQGISGGNETQVQHRAQGSSNDEENPKVNALTALYDWILDLSRNGRDDAVKKYALSESGDYLATYSTALEL